MRKYEAQVARGITFLNKKKRGWRKKINIEMLNMLDSRHCIIGQLYGSYYRFISDIFGDDYSDKSEDHGFTIIEGTPREFLALQKEWIRQMKPQLA